MFTLRRAQVAAFAAAAERAFEDRCVAELRRDFAAGCASLNDAALRDEVRTAVAGATANGLTTVEATRVFIKLQLVFGRGFEQDCRWAEAILQDPTISDEPAKIVRLVRASVEALAAREARGGDEGEGWDVE